MVQKEHGTVFIFVYGRLTGLNYGIVWDEGLPARDNKQDCKPSMAYAQRPHWADRSLPMLSVSLRSGV